MKNILVTGGAGFIGSNFVRYLLENEPKMNVVVLDALTYAGSMENLRDLPDSSRYSFIHGDICRRDQVKETMQEHDIDTIIHFAAETHVDRSILGPTPFIETNIVGTFNLLDAARVLWLEGANAPSSSFRFHHISTDEVYGSLALDDPAFTEITSYAPNSPYAASKAASDHLVRAYSQTYGLPITITNCSNNYGPYQFPEKMIPLMITNAMAGERLPIYGDGLQVRDWLFVLDHCEAIMQVIREGRIGETYNIGGLNQLTNLSLVEMICSILDEIFPESPHRPHSQLVEFVQDRPGHDRRYAMDITKIKHELDWEPKETFESGLRKTMEWYLNSPSWVSAIQNRPTHRDWLEQNYAIRGETK